MALIEASKVLPDIVKEASAFDPEAEAPKAMEKLTDEQVEKMDASNLERISQGVSYPVLHPYKIEECISNLESLSGWDIADTIAGLRAVADAYNRNIEIDNINSSMANAELNRRREAEAEAEAEERYINENAAEIIKGLRAEIEELKAQIG